MKHMSKCWRSVLLCLLVLSMVLGAVACSGDPNSELTDLERLYEEAKEQGYTGTYEEWVQILTGVPGEQGEQGVQGEVGPVGETGMSAYDLYCKHHPWYKGTEEEWTKAMADGSLAASYTDYNIVFTLATIPPVLAALDSVQSGYETYACIERGKTYNGIDNLENFHNVSFNTANNTSAGFSEEQFDAMAAKMKELNKFGNETFHIYIQDGTGIAGFMLAANAGLRKEQYEIILCEDGFGAYNEFQKAYLEGKTVSADQDEPYDAFAAKVDELKGAVQEVLGKTDNEYDDYDYDISRALPLSALDNVTYWFQDESKLVNILKATDDGTNHSKLLTAFGVAGYEDEVDFTVNLRFCSIAEAVDLMSPAQQSSYLQLMYGSYYEDTHAALTRKTLADGTTAVPEKKLVFIGSRAKDYPKLATNAAYGIGGLVEGDLLPMTYESLDDKYKTPLLFGTEADYLLFLHTATDPRNHIGIIGGDDEAVYRTAFNYYIDYIYSLKFTQLIYGEDYDVIIKGHPREVIGEYHTWSSHYTAGSSNFDMMMNALMIAFHEGDSVGKYIGTVPYGTAAENLAYLGVEIAVGGLSSSTYTGYEQSVDVKFVLNAVDYDITGDLNLAGRYNEGNLLDHDADGTEKVTTFYNLGYHYKTLIAYFIEQDEIIRAEQYSKLLQDWLRAQNNLAADADLTGYDVDAQGFLVAPKA